MKIIIIEIFSEKDIHLVPLNIQFHLPIIHELSPNLGTLEIKKYQLKKCESFYQLRHINNPSNEVVIPIVGIKYLQVPIYLIHTPENIIIREKI